MTNDNTILWRSIVGSHVWGMDTPESDIDYFEAFVVPTRDYLSGKNRGYGNHCRQDKVNGLDYTSHEIGKVVEELMKGNINFVIGVMSHKVEYETPVLKALQEIYLANLSKNIFYSCRGMAQHNMKKYKGKDDTPKRINKIVRVLVFGRRVLNGEVNFDYVYQDNYTWSDVSIHIVNLERTYVGSSLPEKPDQEPYRQFLYNVRLQGLNNVDEHR